MFASKFKIHNLWNFNIDVSALYLLAAPSTPEPVRKAVIERAGENWHVTHEEVKALRSNFSETGELPKDLGKLVAMAKDVKKERDARRPLAGAAEGPPHRHNDGDAHQG